MYVVTRAHSREVVAYFTLSAGSVAFTEAPARARRGVPDHPIPVVVLGRLAVDIRHQYAGLGRALLRGSMLQVMAAAEHIGVRALLVHAKTDDVRDWYREQAEFEPFPSDPAALMLLMKELRRNIQDRYDAGHQRAEGLPQQHLPHTRVVSHGTERTCSPSEHFVRHRQFVHTIFVQIWPAKGCVRPARHEGVPGRGRQGACRAERGRPFRRGGAAP